MAKPPKYTNKDLQRLAIAGYNMGPSALNKLLKEHKTLSYNKIKKYLPEETRKLVEFAESNRTDEGGVEMYQPLMNQAFNLSNQGVVDMSNLDLPMLSAHIYKESYSPKTQTKYDLNAYNPSGAKGLGQFTPITIEEFKRQGWLKEGEDPYSADKASELILKYQDHMAKNFSKLAKDFKLGGPIPKAQGGLNNNWTQALNQFFNQNAIGQPPVLSSDVQGVDHTQFPTTNPGEHKRPRVAPLQPLPQILPPTVGSQKAPGYDFDDDMVLSASGFSDSPDKQFPNILGKIGSALGNVLPVVGGMAMNAGALAVAHGQQRELSKQSMFGEMARLMKNSTVPINKGMNASMLPTAKLGGSIPTSNLGQWKYPGQTVKVPSNNITMQGISHPNLGVGDNGMVQMMFPGMNYKFPGAKSVIEIPMLRYGGAGVKKYQDGDMIDPSLASLSQILTLRNQNLPWVDRATSGNTQATYNNAGQAQTHLMGYDGPDRNGNAYVFPTLDMTQSLMGPNMLMPTMSAPAMRIPNMRLADFYTRQGLIKH